MGGVSMKDVGEVRDDGCRSGTVVLRLMWVGWLVTATHYVCA